MKILVISDLHSNAHGVEAIWECESDADAIYAAGDYVDYGPEPMAAIDWVRAHNAHCVRGNHDDRLIRIWNSGEYKTVSPDQTAWVHHNCRRMTQPYVDFLSSLPTHLSFEADGIAYLMTHRYGDGYQIIESQYHFDRYWAEHFNLPNCQGMPRRMIFGHSHRQQILSFGKDALWLNPGSASYRRPDEPSKDAFYAVIQNGEIDLRHVPYPRESLYAEAVRMRPNMMEDEWRVADFFFGWKEEDGPDTAWLELLAERKKRGLTPPGRC